MHDKHLADQDYPTFGAVHIDNLVKLQEILAQRDAFAIKRLDSDKLAVQALTPAVRLKSHVVDLLEPVGELAWDEHEPLKDQKESVHARYHGHADDEIRNNNRHELRRGLGKDERQKHVQIVPHRLAESGHSYNDERHQKQASSAAPGI